MTRRPEALAHRGFLLSIPCVITESRETAQRARGCRRLLTGASSRGAVSYAGTTDRLNAVAEIELLQDVGDVGLDGRITDVQLPRDLGVGESAGDQPKHIELPVGQLV